MTDTPVRRLEFVRVPPSSRGTVPDRLDTGIVALDAARGALAVLGPGECAVAAREHTSDLGPSGPWLVLRGTLAALLAVGLERLRLDAGAVRGSIAVQDGASAADVLESALAWAVGEWSARGCEGEPPPMADAVRAACAVLPRHT